MNINEREDFRGMNLQEYRDIIILINKHHRFGVFPEDGDRLEEDRMIKYIDTCYDTRSNTFWSITFRGLSNTITFRTNASIDIPFDNLFEWLKAFLLGEWKDDKVPKSEQKPWNL